jgi:hypothetical protein
LPARFQVKAPDHQQARPMALHEQDALFKRILGKGDEHGFDE